MAAGVTPTIKSLSLLLGCLRAQETQREKSIFDDTMFSPYDFSKDLPASILDGNGLYDPRALALFDVKFRLRSPFCSYFSCTA